MPIANALSVPNEFSADLQANERRRRMAELLRQQAFEPIAAQQPGVRVSPTQGLAKMLQAYMAGTEERETANEVKSISERAAANKRSTMAEALRVAQGTPETIPSFPNDDEGNPMPIYQAQKGDPQAALSMLMASSDPTLSTLGGTALLKAMEPKDYGTTPQFSGGRGYVVSKAGDIKFLPGVTRDVEYKPLTTAGPDGTPQTTFYDPRNPPQQPVAQPVRKEMVNTGQTAQPVNPYSQQQPIQMTPSPGAVLASDTAKRGQNLVDARSREANSTANDNRAIQLTHTIRTEFNALPEVKAYKEVVPIIQSAKKAPNTSAGDIDLIYAVGKVLDPNSVVREGELALVIKSGSPAQRIQGFANYVQGGGRLAPQQRAQLLEMLNGRVSSLQASYKAARGSYERIATQQGLNPSHVLPSLSDGSGSEVTDAADAILGGR